MSPSEKLSYSNMKLSYSDHQIKYKKYSLYDHLDPSLVLVLTIVRVVAKYSLPDCHLYILSTTIHQLLCQHSNQNCSIVHDPSILTYIIQVLVLVLVLLPVLHPLVIIMVDSRKQKYALHTQILIMSFLVQSTCQIDISLVVLDHSTPKLSLL